MSRHADVRPPVPLMYGRPRSRIEEHLQVLMTYLHRPAFHALIIALVASVVLVMTIQYVQHVTWFHYSAWAFQISNNIVWLLFVMLSFMSPAALTLVSTIMLASHAREQLTNWRTQLIPGCRRPQVRVATLVFFILASALAFTMYWQSPAQRTSLLGFLAITLTLVSLVAWLGVRGSPWMVPVALMICIFIGVNRPAHDALFDFASFLSGERQWSTLPGSFPRDFLSTAIIVADVLITAILFSGAKPAEGGWSGLRSIEFGASGARRATSADPLRPHRPVHGLWSRAWHRRHGVLRPWSAAWAGGVLAIIMLVVFLLSNDRQHVRALTGLILATLTPGMIAAAVWAERWPVLGYESLFPGHRRQFARESALVMAINFAEFWLAATMAMVLALAITEPAEIATTSFALSILASTLTQFVLFGGLFLIAPSRAPIPHVVLMALLLIAAAIPFELAWTPHPELSMSQLVSIAAAESLLGVGLLLVGWSAWERSSLA